MVVARNVKKSRVGEFVKLPNRCPWCGKVLSDGRVIASWRHGVLVSVAQTQMVGLTEYTWMHMPRLEGCHVPELMRISPRV